MHQAQPICTIAILAVTVLCSGIGFRNPYLRQRFLFSTQPIFRRGEYHRLITSAFLHADWNHLILNMVTLFLFGRDIEWALGPWQLLLIYFAAILGGSLASLWLHRQQDYSAYGASGGVCGLVFSTILLFPGGSIYMIPLPVGIPNWLYAVAFLIGSSLAYRAQSDNIGHDAHLGGAVTGLLVIALLHPDLVKMQPTLFLILIGLAVVLFLWLNRIQSVGMPPRPARPPRPRFRLQKQNPEKRRRRESAEVDAILEKISQHGIHSLTPEEKALLDGVSAKYRRRAESRKPKSDLIL